LRLTRDGGTHFELEEPRVDRDEPLFLFALRHSVFVLSTRRFDLLRVVDESLHFELEAPLLHNELPRFVFEMTVPAGGKWPRRPQRRQTPLLEPFGGRRPTHFELKMARFKFEETRSALARATKQETNCGC
jgi:hypothetical protein